MKCSLAPSVHLYFQVPLDRLVFAAITLILTLNNNYLRYKDCLLYLFYFINLASNAYYFALTVSELISTALGGLSDYAVIYCYGT
jgi:hypothetical protein